MQVANRINNEKLFLCILTKHSTHILQISILLNLKNVGLKVNFYVLQVMNITKSVTKAKETRNNRKFQNNLPKKHSEIV